MRCLEWCRYAEASHAVGDIVLTNPWPLAPETPLWPKSDTSLLFLWLDGGSWLLFPLPERNHGNSVLQLTPGCFATNTQNTFQSYSQTLETTISNVCLSYMKWQIMLLLFSIPLKAWQIFRLYYWRGLGCLLVLVRNTVFQFFYLSM